jgi:hypothetical protein
MVHMPCKPPDRCMPVLRTRAAMPPILVKRSEPNRKLLLCGAFSNRLHGTDVASFQTYLLCALQFWFAQTATVANSVPWTGQMVFTQHEPHLQQPRWLFWGTHSCGCVQVFTLDTPSGSVNLTTAVNGEYSVSGWQSARWPCPMAL